MLVVLVDIENKKEKEIIDAMQMILILENMLHSAIKLGFCFDSLCWPLHMLQKGEPLRS